jgi:hypothetical protein
LVGDSAGDIVLAGLALDLVLDLVVVTDMDTEVVAGGAPPFIILPYGVDGVVAEDPMDSTEIISPSAIVFMSITQTMCTEIVGAYTVKIIFVPEA